MKSSPHHLSGHYPPFDAVAVFTSDADQSVVAAMAALLPVDRQSPFQHAAWLEIWTRHVGDPRRLTQLTIVAYRAGKPAMLLPLSLRRGRLLSKLVWRAEETCDYCGPLADPAIIPQLSHETFSAMLAETVALMGGADVIRLAKQAVRPGERPAAYLGNQTITYHVGAHATALTGNFQQYCTAKRSGRTLRKIKNRWNAMHRLGQVELAFAKNRPEAISLVARCLDLKAAQLRKEGFWNPLSGRGTAAMLISFFGSRIDRDTWVAALKLDGKPVAIAYGFRNPSTWLVYQLAMAGGPADNYSPGQHLLMFLMRHCSEQGVRIFDLSLGDESYKRDWCELKTTIVAAIMPLTLKGRLYRRAFVLASWLRQQISGRPALYGAAKIINRNLKTLSMRA